jgi:hypothetical protein
MASAVKQYEVAELSAATNNFHRGRFLGNGTFGQVFQARLDGAEVAVKRMGTRQRTEEMQAERERHARLRHDCLLPCLGMVRAAT